MLFTKKLKILLQSNVFYLFLLCVLSLWLLFFLFGPFQFIPDNRKALKVLGILLEYKIDGDQLSCLLKDKEKFKVKYHIKSKEEKERLFHELKIGKEILFYGEKQEILSNTIPNTFNYKEYLKRHKISFVFQADKIHFANNKISFMNQVKNAVDYRIKKLGDNAYLRAFILGDTYNFLKEINESIRINGISHLFALSGMHLALVYAFLNKILSKFKKKQIVIYTFLFLYLLVSGVSVSFLRAILLLLANDINKNLHLGISKIKLLFLIAMLFLFFNPYYLYDIGYWYTFIITFSLLLNQKRINKYSKIKQVLVVSFIPFLFSAPITIYTNYELNLLAPFNNLFIVLFVSSIVFPLALFSFFCSPFLLPFTFCISVLEKVNLFLASHSLMIIFGKISIFAVLLFYFFFISFSILRKKSLLFLVLVECILLYYKSWFDLNYSLYYLDVGQGDATLLVSPHHQEAILIDTGGKLNYQKKEFQIKNHEFDLTDSLVPFFKSIRIRKLDLLVLTHGDFDHIGYANGIIQKLRVQKIMLNPGDYTNGEKSLFQYKIPMVKTFDSKYFHPKVLTTKIYDNENDNSVVLYLNLNHYKFLFMGDAGIEREQDILDKYNLSMIDFLKIGHHGSETSSNVHFIHKIKPKNCIISVGRKNRYGHPKASVLDLLRDCTLYRTDLNGSIKIKIRNNQYSIQTMK